MWLPVTICCCCLFAIGYLDFKIRAVYVWLFAFLALLLLLLKQQESRAILMDEQVGINLFFLFLQFAVLQVYFRIKTGTWQQLMDKKIGWGDMVFLLCMALYLPFLSFFVFYILSLLIVLILTALLPRWRNVKIGIPLAGCQALLFGLWLILQKLNIIDWETFFSNWFMNMTV
ncbi:hypothetical protein LZQ00_10095 [Sphingobacterium sp. SRCM116780]|uniref:hypothetical protein n=1 Tax=Sphingobacterium sp. SRCM116780 TaxID=2907623 RepID=UPI001F2E142B|nr:hypothetical protein [Sphingobacterium sp. SRCM116780]UIR54625.1 hypothetical protein LZQ00_10095 [Sphingobacterium sp. SRCM116780]